MISVNIQNSSLCWRIKIYVDIINCERNLYIVSVIVPEERRMSKLPWGPVFRFLNPVIHMCTLTTFSTSSHFSLYLPPTSHPCFFALLVNLYLPFPQNFSFQVSYIHMSFKIHSTTVLPVSQIYSCELRFLAFFVLWISIHSWCVCVCLFFLYLYCVLVFDLEISCE